VLDEHIRVNAPAFCIERIGLALGQGTDNLYSSEHLEFSTSFWLPQKVCFPGILFLCRTSGHMPRKDAWAEATSGLRRAEALLVKTSPKNE
jgi:hypothetical protein